MKADRNLYRIMPLKFFFEMIKSQKLYFVRPKLWMDKHEGFLFQKLKSPQGIKEVELAVSQFPPNLSRRCFIESALAFEKTFYAQSWSLRPHSAAMWRDYNHDNSSVRIEINESDIQKLHLVHLIDIEYVDAVNLYAELDRVFGQGDSVCPMEAYRIKRRDFDHEQEVRLIYINPEALVEKPKAQMDQWRAAVENLRHSDPILAKAIEKEVLSEIQDHQLIDFNQVRGFIKSIMLHPHANSDLDRELANFCSRHELNYLGKSKLYDPV